MNKSILESRTRAFAIGVIRLSESVEGGRAADVIIRQLLRSATSIGANYHEANRAESRKDFVHKIGIVEKEAAETLYWLELVEECGFASGTRIETLRRESRELLAIFTAIGRSTKAGSGSMQIRDGGKTNSDFEFLISNIAASPTSVVAPPPRKSPRLPKPSLKPNPPARKRK